MQKESTHALEDYENHKREKLKTKRKRLFERFLNNPANTGLAVEIKSIDDYVADHMVENQKQK
jgi:hypothetical protein